jgi:hypothetical protein
MERPQSLRRRHLERISAAAALREARSSNKSSDGHYLPRVLEKTVNDLRQNTNLRFKTPAAPDPASRVLHAGACSGSGASFRADGLVKWSDTLG